MKSILGVLLLLSSVVHAQNKPHKGAEKIVVAVDTVNIISRLSMALYERGYSLSQKDETLKFIAATPKGVKSHNANMIIQALVKGDTLIFSGSTSINVQVGMINSNDQYSPLKYTGMKGSIIRDAWAELESIAKGFGTVSYK